MDAESRRLIFIVLVLVHSAHCGPHACVCFTISNIRVIFMLENVHKRIGVSTQTQRFLEGELM